MNLEKMPSGTEASKEVKKEEEKFPSADEIKPGVIESIEKEDALDTEAALKEIRDFKTQEKGVDSGNKEQLLALSAQKIEEMQAEVDKKKKGIFNKMLFTEKDITAAESSIVNAKNMIARGELPDIHSIQKRIKFAGNVDLSGLPEREGKQYYSNRHTFGGGA